jgi:hypothetical protein
MRRAQDSGSRRAGATAKKGFIPAAHRSIVRRVKRLVWFLVILAVLFRLGFFAFALKTVPFSSDEAWPGLMAMHILKGEFPVVYWGQSYMGTQESFFQAGTIALCGPTVFAVRIYALLMCFLFLLASWQLARRIGGDSAGVTLLALLAIPPPYLAMNGALIPPDNYLACITLGSFALVLVHDLAFKAEEPRRLVKFIALAFLLGFAFWLHILVVSYIGVCGLILFLRDKLLFLRREAWAGAAAFIAGALPLLIYNVIHHGATFRDVGQTTSWHRSLELLRGAFEVTLQFLIGTKAMLYGDNDHFAPLPAVLAILIAVIWIVAILWALLSRWKMFARLPLLSLKNSDGVILLAAIAGAALFTFCRSSRSGWKDVRYLLPIMSALPVLLALGLDQLRAKSRWLFGLLLGVLLLGQGWGVALLAKNWLDPKVMAVDLELPDSRPLHQWMQAHGLTRAYAHYWIAYRCTYEAAENILYAEPYNERFPRRAADVKFKAELDSATNLAYIAHPTLRFFSGDFDAALKNIGAQFQKEQVGHFTLYHDFVPPYGRTALRELPRAGWQVTASAKAGDAAKVLDGKNDTCWTTGAPQVSNMTFAVDFGAPQTLCLLRCDLGANVTDAPAAFRVEASADGVAWKMVQDSSAQGSMMFWENGQPRFNVYGDHFTVAFAPVTARHLRLVLTETNPRAWWTLAELRAFAPLLHKR